MRYACYEASTGKILQWGMGDPPSGVDYIEHENEGDLTDFCVVDGALSEKTEMSLTLPSSPTAADGISEAVISGLPAGTLSDFFIAGQYYSVVVDDGSLELSVYDPGVVRIRFWHPTYKHAPVEVTFA